jgi:hypothetical protein
MDKSKRMAQGEINDLEKMRKSGKMTKPTKKAGAFIVEMSDAEPTEKEKEMMRQMVRERKMDEGTERGANQYEDTKLPVKKAMGGMVPGYAKGGVVTKGNGCAIRGVKKCKMY